MVAEAIFFIQSVYLKHRNLYRIFEFLAGELKKKKKYLPKIINPDMLKLNFHFKEWATELKSWTSKGRIQQSKKNKNSFTVTQMC